MLLECQSMGITLRQYIKEHKDKDTLADVLAKCAPYYIACIAVAACVFKLRDMGPGNVAVTSEGDVDAPKFSVVQGVGVWSLAVGACRYTTALFLRCWTAFKDHQVDVWPTVAFSKPVAGT